MRNGQHSDHKRHRARHHQAKGVHTGLGGQPGLVHPVKQATVLAALALAREAGGVVGVGSKEQARVNGGSNDQGHVVLYTKAK